MAKGVLLETRGRGRDLEELGFVLGIDEDTALGCSERVVYCWRGVDDLHRPRCWELAFPLWRNSSTLEIVQSQWNHLCETFH